MNIAIESIYRRTREDIFMFCAAMNFRPTWQQASLLTAVMDATAGRGSNWIACKSGQGPGKTTVAAIIGLWRSWRVYGAMTVLTAPTMRQCSDVYLAEVRRLMEKADPALRRFFNVTQRKVEIAGMPDWGIKTVTATRVENAHGYHQANMTIIAEEASGIPRDIITQFKGTLSNADSIFLQIGNPSVRDCAFYDCFQGPGSPRWRQFTLNAEDTARDYPQILSPRRNEDLAREFGRDSDVYRVRVLGEFPSRDPDSVMSDEMLWPMTDRARCLPCVRMSNTKQFGIDFARFGGDENVCYRRSGRAIIEWESLSNAEPVEIVRRAFEMQRKAGWRDNDCWYVPDASGMGQGVLSHLYEAHKQVFEWHNGGRSPMADFKNRITMGWFLMARMVRSPEGIYLPDDTSLIQQLSSRKYYTDLKGKLVLEDKDEYMKRGHDSPDRAEACVLSFCDILAASAMGGSVRHAQAGSAA